VYDLPAAALHAYTNRINIVEFGRGGGDRTHDLRLKRPLLYH
jgi:hypothetical protein